MVLLAFLFVNIPLVHVADTNTHPQHLKQNMVAFEWDNSNFINDKDDKKLSMIPPIPFWGIQIVLFTSQLLLLILSAAIYSYKETPLHQTSFLPVQLSLHFIDF